MVAYIKIFNGHCQGATINVYPGLCQVINWEKVSSLSPFYPTKHRTRPTRVVYFYQSLAIKQPSLRLKSQLAQVRGFHFTNANKCCKNKYKYVLKTKPKYLPEIGHLQALWRGESIKNVYFLANTLQNKQTTGSTPWQGFQQTSRTQPR